MRLPACSALGVAVALAALPAGAARAEDLPPPPTPPAAPDPYEPVEPPSFGTDVAVAYAVGSLLGSWPDPGVHCAALARVDAFLVDRDQPGPRLGLSLWGSTTAWPLQRYSEEGGPQSEPFRYTHYGIMTVLRGDPEAPISAAAGLGFGRLDLESYAGGPLAIPTLGFEGGPRVRAGRSAFLDVLARASWGTTRSPSAASWHEWWSVQVLVSPGLRVR